MQVRDLLAARAFEVFCPYERTVIEVTSRSAGSNGKKKVLRDLPVFPNYLFVDEDTGDGERAKNTQYVLDVLSMNGHPVTIPEAEVVKWRAAAAPDGLTKITDVTKPSFAFRGRRGDRFRFAKNSPFAGFIGRIESILRLDETGAFSAKVEILGGERLVTVRHDSVDQVILQDGLSFAA